MKTETLYTTTDVARVREKLLKEQEGLDLLTHLPIPAGQAVLDHDHKSQYVRGVLHRQSNAVLGKLENLWVRYLGWWYNGTLSTFLRQAANYLERKETPKYVHPGWIKQVNTRFNKLTAKEQNALLLDLWGTTGANPATRKRQFNAGCKSKKYSYEYISKKLGPK